MAEETLKLKIKKDDQVKVIAGKDKGKTGKIVSIDRAKARAIVAGLNIVKKTKRKKSQQDRGGIIDIEAPIHVSNLMIMCRKCGPTRIGYKIEGDSKKRVCRKCGEAL